MTQFKLFEAREEMEKRDRALVRVSENSDERLRWYAEQAVENVLLRDGNVDSTRARESMRELTGCDFREPRAWGPIIMAAARKHKLVRVGYREGGSHGRPIAVWGKRDA